MGRYRGEVEQARKDLRDMGMSQATARDRAPRLAELRQSKADSEVCPYPWLGGKSNDIGSEN